MIQLPRVTFVIDQFAVPSPGQQLLDRFLIGYNSDGTFRVPGCEVDFAGELSPLIDQRTKDFGLKVGADLKAARTTVIAASEERVRESLAAMPERGRCFIYGLLSPEAQRIADGRKILAMSGTGASAAFRLPNIEIAEERVRKCAIVTTGATAALDGLDALGSLLGTRLFGLRFARKIERFWETVYSADWRELLAAAFTRSNTIQGDPVKDGRPQDVFGLHFLERLAPGGRGWLLNRDDGLTVGIFDFSGALNDLDFAVEMNDGTIRSAQLYRPPEPMSDHFSVLAERIERFFRTDSPEVPSGVTSLWRAAEQMNS